jgi:hypothetical protein
MSDAKIFFDAQPIATAAIEQCEGAGLPINSNQSPDVRARALLEWQGGEVLLLDDEFIH